MRVFISHTFDEFEQVSVLRNVLVKAGHMVISPELPWDDTDIGPLSSDNTTIQSCDAVVVILSDIFGRPNLFYELGVAVGAGIPVFLMVRSPLSVPADLRHIAYSTLEEDPVLNANFVLRRLEMLEPRRPVQIEYFDTAQETLAAAINRPDFLDSISPAEFEYLVQALFHERGFQVLPQKEARDIGFDFYVLHPSSANLIPVEIKKYSRNGRVSVDSVRRFSTIVSLLGVPSGMLITTYGGTAAASAMAAGGPIVLLNLKQFLDSPSLDPLSTLKDERLLASSDES